MSLSLSVTLWNLISAKWKISFFVVTMHLLVFHGHVVCSSIEKCKFERNETIENRLRRVRCHRSRCRCVVDIEMEKKKWKRVDSAVVDNFSVHCTWAHRVYSTMEKCEMKWFIRLRNIGASARSFHFFLSPFVKFCDNNHSIWSIYFDWIQWLSFLSKHNGLHWRRRWRMSAVNGMNQNMERN